MTCLTGGRTPCGAATGIPGRPATSSSPTCRARAVLTKASPGTPWSTARPTAAAQPGTARDTTRPTRGPPPPPGSRAGSHRHPTQGDPEPTEAFDSPAITSHPATAADTSRLAGSRSHRGSAHGSSWRHLETWVHGRDDGFTVRCHTGGIARSCAPRPSAGSPRGSAQAGSRSGTSGGMRAWTAQCFRTWRSQ